MKQISLLFAALIISSIAKAQCEAPEILDWTAIDDSTFTISYFSSTDGNILLDIDNEYLEISFFSDDVLELEGMATAGLNELTFTISENNLPAWAPPVKTLYFTAKLSLFCTETSFSEISQFYISAHSLASDIGFNCDSLYMPFENIPNWPGDIYIDVEDNNEVIESISVFLDIGHRWNGDLSISLIHPNGTEIELIENAWFVLGASTGMSVIFTDAATQNLSNSPDSIGPRGIFLPDDPLSILIGEPSAGEWTLSVNDNVAQHEGMIFGVCLNINGIPCSTFVEGTAFYDFNENGIQNAPEPIFPFAFIENSISGDQFYTDADGGFWNCSEEGTGTLEVQNVPEYYEGAIVDISLMEDEQLEGVLIPITASELISDVAVDLISLNANRPGFEATYLAQVSNVGTICQDDVNLSLSFPDYVEIVSSGNPDLIFSGNTATMEVGEVCPFAPVEFNFVILLDDTVSLGTILEATAIVTPTDGDANELNNTFTSSVIVVGSYDPNDKQVSATTIGDAFLEEGASLKYTIRFQNTGTFYAERVVIADTIDADLDLNSLHVISTSHDMQLVREGNVLYFEFDQIFLPDSTTDFDGSIGHVRYEITPLSGFSEGDMIENTTYIYFDFNAPIITNTVVTSFQNPLSISNEVEFETRLFPNPASQSITISWAQDVEVDRIEIYDLSGRLLQENNIRNSAQTTLDVSNLVSGIYLLKVNARELISSNIFIKE